MVEQQPEQSSKPNKRGRPKGSLNRQDISDFDPVAVARRIMGAEPLSSRPPSTLQQTALFKCSKCHAAIELSYPPYVINHRGKRVVVTKQEAALVFQTGPDVDCLKHNRGGIITVELDRYEFANLARGSQRFTSENFRQKGGRPSKHP